MIFGVPYRLAAMIAIGIAVLVLVSFFVDFVYKLGVSDERAKWEARAAQVQTQTNDAVREITGDNQTERLRIDQALEDANELLEAASDEDDLGFMLAWASADRSLCDAACAG